MVFHYLVSFFEAETCLRHHEIFHDFFSSCSGRCFRQRLSINIASGRAVTSLFMLMRGNEDCRAPRMNRVAIRLHRLDISGLQHDTT